MQKPVMSEYLETVDPDAKYIDELQKLINLDPKRLNPQNFDYSRNKIMKRKLK
jgi:hypothetical protein